MGKIFMAILLSLATVSMVGCATKWDVDLAKQNTQRIGSFNISQTNQTMYRTGALAEVAGSYECADPNSPDCGAVMAMMKYRSMEALENIEGQQYKGPVETTGLDVYKKLAEKADRILNALENPLTALIGGQEEPETINLDGDGNTIHFEENHATALKDSTATLDQSTSSEIAAEESGSEEEE